MKSFTLIALGTFILLSSEGWAGKGPTNKTSSDSADENNSHPHVKLKPSLERTQTFTSLKELVKQGRVNGFSPNILQVDFINNNQGKKVGLVSTRGTTFYIANTSNRKPPR